MDVSLRGQAPTRSCLRITGALRLDVSLLRECFIPPRLQDSSTAFQKNQILCYVDGTHYRPTVSNWHRRRARDGPVIRGIQGRPQPPPLLAPLWRFRLWNIITDSRVLNFADGADRPTPQVASNAVYRSLGFPAFYGASFLATTVWCAYYGAGRPLDARIQRRNDGII